MRPDKDMEPGEFLAHAGRNFAEAAGDWLTGREAVHGQAQSRLTRPTATTTS